MFKYKNRSLSDAAHRLRLPLILLFLIGLIFSFGSTGSKAQKQPGNSNQPNVESSSDDLTEGDYLLNQYKLNVSNWPNAIFNFMIQNKKQQVFDQLKIGDLKVQIDDRPVIINPSSLRMTESDPVGILILVDGSRSMLPKPSGATKNLASITSFDKLDAAKEAIRFFLNKLRERDSAAIYAFDSSLYLVSGPTRVKSDLIQKIGEFEIRAGEMSLSTDLYQSLMDAIDKTKESKFRNLVIISDGMQDTLKSEEIRLIDDTQFTSYKRDWELRIRKYASDSGVTIFSIPIGDRNATPATPKNSKYVDADALCNITSARAGGNCAYIDLPELIREQAADNSSASLQTALRMRLEKVFENINHSVRYGYELSLPLAAFPHDEKRHLLKINLKVGANSFDVTYPLTWTQNGIEGEEPIFKVKRFFLPAPAVGTAPAQLGVIYLKIFGGLAFLAVIPLFIQRFQTAKLEKERTRLIKHSVVVLKKGSNMIGRDDCPNHSQRSFKPFVEGDILVLCPKCSQPHHIECWRFNKCKCMAFTCTGDLQIPDEVLTQYGLAKS